MLELQLRRTGNSQVQVWVNSEFSHTFDLDTLKLDEKKFQGFYNDPREFGTVLYDSLFTGEAAKRALKALPKAPSEEGAIVIISQMEIEAIPWEYTWTGTALLSTDYMLLRALPAEDRPRPIEFPRGAPQRAGSLFRLFTSPSRK